MTHIFLFFLQKNQGCFVFHALSIKLHLPLDLKLNHMFIFNLGIFYLDERTLTQKTFIFIFQ